MCGRPCSNSHTQTEHVQSSHAACRVPHGWHQAPPLPAAGRPGSLARCNLRSRRSRCDSGSRRRRCAGQAHPPSSRYGDGCDSSCRSASCSQRSRRTRTASSGGLTRGTAERNQQRRRQPQQQRQPRGSHGEGGIKGVKGSAGRAAAGTIMLTSAAAQLYGQYPTCICAVNSMSLPQCAQRHTAHLLSTVSSWQHRRHMQLCVSTLKLNGNACCSSLPVRLMLCLPLRCSSRSRVRQLGRSRCLRRLQHHRWHRRPQQHRRRLRRWQHQRRRQSRRRRRMKSCWRQARQRKRICNAGSRCGVVCSWMRLSVL